MTRTNNNETSIEAIIAEFETLYAEKKEMLCMYC